MPVSKLVRHTAKEMAGAFFENEDTFQDGRVMRTERFRALGLTQEQFVRKYWPDFVVAARKTLAHMLMLPGVEQSDKDKIFDALLEDRGAPTDLQLAAPSILQMDYEDAKRALGMQ